jgi:hypothetical protein
MFWGRRHFSRGPIDVSISADAPNRGFRKIIFGLAFSNPEGPLVFAQRVRPSATKGKDEKQSARFIETARKLEVDESGGPFQSLLRKIIRPKKS